MSETQVTHRSRGEDAIYFASAKNRYVGSVSLGYGPDGKRIRRKVLGKTKQEVRDRLKALHKEMDAGSSPRRPTRCGGLWRTGCATVIPSRVLIRSRSTSNSAKVARMLKNILPIGSVGS
jgi:hypothetical protein